MKIWLRTATILAMGVSVPLMAQPATAPVDNAAISVEALEERRAIFAWLLGTWRGDHMFGPNSSRAGAQVTFYLEADGTVSARLDKTSEWMDSSEKLLAELVGQRFIRGISTSNSAPSVWTNSAGGGSVINKNDGQWTNLGIVYVDAETGKLSHLGGISDFSHWVKISGSTAARPAGTTAAPGADPTPGTGSEGAPAPATTAQPTAPASEEAPTNNKRCDYSFYSMLVGESTKSVIATFEHDVDEVATYDPDMPAGRLYPSPVESATDIPRFLDFEDYQALQRIEAVTGELIANSGPDAALIKAETQIRKLYLEARRQYDVAAQDAEARGEPCPKFTHQPAYQSVLQADQAMAQLRANRDQALQARMADATRLHEKMTRQFYSDLADASSIDEKINKAQSKAYDLVKGQLKSMLTGEGIAAAKVEALAPQLDALRERYASMEAQGKPVSDAQRDKDLKAALKRSGIDYDPAIARTAKRDGQTAIGKMAYDYAASIILTANGKAPTGIIGKLSAMKGAVGNIKNHAEILNSLKNYYDLLGVEEDVLPLAVAVHENRAYITGLLQRYDIMEQEYALLRKNFENAVTSGGELSEKD